MRHEERHRGLNPESRNDSKAFLDMASMVSTVYDSLQMVGADKMQVQARADRPRAPARLLSQVCLPSNEKHFPEAFLQSGAFHSQVRAGQDFVKDKRIIFAGLWRQIGAQAVNLLYTTLATLGSFFKDYQIIMLENDSADDTVKGINDVCGNDPRGWCFTLKGLGKMALHENVPDRVKGLTALRYALLQKVKEFDSTNIYDFVMMVDGDIFAEGNGGFDIAATLSALALAAPSNDHGLGGPGANWEAADAICAFQLAGRSVLYRDTFAHRGPQCSYEDLAKSSVCPADSCGGGLVVYSMKAIRESVCDYTYVDEKTCEHVPFNQCLSKHGHGRIFLFKAWAIPMADSNLGGRSDWNCVNL